VTDNPASQTIPRAASSSWRRAGLLAVGAVYGPQLLLGFYTLGFVSCQHCRETVWKMMAIAPGLELALVPMLLLRWHPSFGETVSSIILSFLSLLIVLGVAAWVRRWPRWRWLFFGWVFLVFSFGAFVLLSLIRA